MGSVQGTLALENFGNRGIGDARRLGYFRLRNALGLDKVTEHFHVGNRGNGMGFAFVLFNQVAKHLEVIFFFRGKVFSVQQRIDYLDRRVQFLVRTNRAKRKADDQRKI